MDVTAVTLATQERVFLLDKFFPGEVLCNLHTICKGFTKESPHWTQPKGFNHSRWEYLGTEPEWIPVKEYLGSAELIDSLSQLVGKPVHLSNTGLWVIFNGVPKLRPHVEGAGEYVSQVFVTPATHDLHGTTFYTAEKNILFQLPYRDNSGWLFHGQRVLHGRAVDVPEGVARYSIMMWYNQNQ